ncbi:hypothetical protein [Thiothrix eikelboomii]|uniref:hypothetical protein n=1 Tax=Thiothrix eikelboomii TaxID=92487 RepID=UPI003BB0C8A1
MKVVIDECLPKRLASLIQDAEVKTVPQLGLAGTKDKELLVKLEALQIDVFITIDGNLEFQQNFKNRSFGTVIIRAISNRFQDLVVLEPELNLAIQQVSAGDVHRIP